MPAHCDLTLLIYTPLLSKPIVAASLNVTSYCWPFEKTHPELCIQPLRLRSLMLELTFFFFFFTDWGMADKPKLSCIHICHVFLIYPFNHGAAVIFSPERGWKIGASASWVFSSGLGEAVGSRKSKCSSLLCLFASPCFTEKCWFPLATTSGGQNHWGLWETYL